MSRNTYTRSEFYDATLDAWQKGKTEAHAEAIKIIREIGNEAKKNKVEGWSTPLAYVINRLEKETV